MQIKFIRLIDDLFVNLPQSRETLELKEEMVQNLMERYNDLLAEGKSAEEAFDIAAAGVGDVNELIAELLPSAPEPHDSIGNEAEDPEADDPQREWYRSFGFEGADTVAMVRHRAASLTALGVMLYILCPVPVILFGGRLGVMLLLALVAAATGLFIHMGMAKPKKSEMPEFGLNGGYATLSREAHRRQTAKTTTVAVMLYIFCAAPVILFSNMIGVSLLLAMVAAATGMFIYDGIAKPKKREMTDDPPPPSRESHEYLFNRGNKHRGKAGKPMSGAVSGITLALYLLISFQTGAWHITWIIFLVGVAVNNIIKAYNDMREGGGRE